jgi:sporulation protein YlmC with PRC-barrel domain
MNYRAIIFSGAIGVLTACHSRPIVQQPDPAQREPEAPAELPSPTPASEDPNTEQSPVPNAEVADSKPPSLPEVAKPKVAAKRKPRPTPESENPTPAEPQTAQVAATPEVKPVEASVASILGKKVQDSNGENLGRVVDVQADADGRVRLVIVEFGGFLGVGDRRVAIDWGLLRFHPDDPEQAISLSVSAKQVQGTPEYRQASHPRALMAPQPK